MSAVNYPLRAKLACRMRRRLRGFTMIETVLVLAVGMGVLIGGVLFYMQLEGSAQKNDKLNHINAVAAEMKTLGRSLVSYDDIQDPTSNPPVAQGKNVKDAAIVRLSGLHEATFANIDVESDGDGFYLHLFDLNDGTCRQLRITDFGPGVLVASATDCANGLLSIYYGPEPGQPPSI